MSGKADHQFHIATPAELRTQKTPVSKDELNQRLALVRAEMRARGIGVSLFTTPENIGYLSGYSTRAITAMQVLLIDARSEAVLVVRRMDEGNYLRMKDRSPITRHVIFTDDRLQDTMEIIAGLARDIGGAAGAIGLELDGMFLPPKQYDLLKAALSGADIANIGAMVDDLRLVKSSFEVACHRYAGAMTAAAMKRAISNMRPGMTDSVVAADVAAGLIDAGSEWVATWPIILTGRESGRVHSSWQNEEIREGEPTLLEFSAARHRYHSPLLRTVIFSPNDEQRRMSEAVSEACRAGVEAIRPGATAEDVYFAERTVMERYGVADMMSGRVGYTVGVGFAPNWVQRGGVDFMRGNKTVLKPGMVFHMPILLMQADIFGIGHSNTVVVTENGNEMLADDGFYGPVLI